MKKLFLFLVLGFLLLPLTSQAFFYSREPAPKIISNSEISIGGEEEGECLLDSWSIVLFPSGQTPTTTAQTVLQLEATGAWVGTTVGCYQSNYTWITRYEVPTGSYYSLYYDIEGSLWFPNTLAIPVDNFTVIDTQDIYYQNLVESEIPLYQVWPWEFWFVIALFSAPFLFFFTFILKVLVRFTWGIFGWMKTRQKR